MAEIKCTRWTSMDGWQHLRHLMKIKREELHYNRTSCDDAASSRHFISNEMDAT